METSPDAISLQKAALCNSILAERICRGKHIQIRISHFKNMERKLLWNSQTSARETWVQKRKEKPSWGFHSWESLGTLFFRIFIFLEMQWFFPIEMGTGSVKWEFCSWKGVCAEVEKVRSPGAAWLLQDPKTQAQIYKMGLISVGRIKNDKNESATNTKKEK